MSRMYYRMWVKLVRQSLSLDYYNYIYYTIVRAVHILPHVAYDKTKIVSTSAVYYSITTISIVFQREQSA